MQHEYNACLIYYHEDKSIADELTHFLEANTEHRNKIQFVKVEYAGDFQFNKPILPNISDENKIRKKVERICQESLVIFLLNSPQSWKSRWISEMRKKVEKRKRKGVIYVLLDNTDIFIENDDKVLEEISLKTTPEKEKIQRFGEAIKVWKDSEPPEEDGHILSETIDKIAENLEELKKKFDSLSRLNKALVALVGSVLFASPVIPITIAITEHPGSSVACRLQQARIFFEKP